MSRAAQRRRSTPEIKRKQIEPDPPPVLQKHFPRRTVEPDHRTEMKLGTGIDREFANVNAIRFRRGKPTKHPSRHARVPEIALCNDHDFRPDASERRCVFQNMKMGVARSDKYNTLSHRT
jgi:hypothetical protein